MNAERALEMGMDYNFGQKNHWRRWLHNRIAERLRVPAREAVVLYLAGEQDLDRREFLRRGYRPDNLIAVDLDGAVVATLRRRGVIAIEGDIATIARVWPRRLDVVIADFTSGLRNKLFLEVADATCGNPGPVWAVNLLRGREEGGNQIIGEKLNIAGYEPQAAGMEKHRGLRMLIGIPAALASGVMQGVPYATWRGSYLRLVDEYAERSNPAFYSYLSTSGQVFDTVVFESAAMQLLDVGIPRNTSCDQTIKRRVAAAIAHSTRRVGRPMPINDTAPPVLH